MTIFWFRRDLRIDDNVGFSKSLESSNEVLPIFIFDSELLSKLENKYDKRVNFVYNEISELKKKLESLGSTLLVLYGKPSMVFKQLKKEYDIDAVYTNNNYEPYAIHRDKDIRSFFNYFKIPFYSFKDQVIFEQNEIVKDDGSPYTVFTPYMKKWKQKLSNTIIEEINHINLKKLHKCEPKPLLSIEEIGFKNKEFTFPEKAINIDVIKNYHLRRDFPSLNGTSKLGIHIRFGTISIRKLVKTAIQYNEKWLNELIWREFYNMLIYFFPYTVDKSFKPAYDNIEWRFNENLFYAWCNGKTGYPIVDAGMHELNKTGFMHNRLRMITSSFLTKHLFHDWRLGEAYFKNKLLDYDAASNIGGWQWAAGSGCDAAPYFRIFNPSLQIKKFDSDYVYIKKWIPNFDSEKLYIKPIVEHSQARENALSNYKKYLNLYSKNSL